MSDRPLRKNRRRDLFWFLMSSGLPLPWVIAQAVGGLGLPGELIAVLAGLAIVGAAFLLSWATELGERDLPQSLALLVLAFVSVLPEYAVDLHFAWQAGTNPTYAHYAVANMTGANRLLIGLGWAAVVLVACRRDRTRVLAVDPRQRLEIRYLLLATLYAFFIPLSGTLSLFDAAVLFAIFAMYVRRAATSESVRVELVGPAAIIDREFRDRGRRLWATALLVFAGFSIFVSAEPFAESLVKLGVQYEIDEFLLVQWVAPLASESPEFLVAILFAVKRRGSIGMGALISSKVNQWTLLVGALPIAFCISAGQLSGLPLDARQQAEIWLTCVQSLLATVLVCTLRFRRRDALLLAILFLGQLFFPWTKVRYGFIALYALITVALLVGDAARRRAFIAILFPSRAEADAGVSARG
jgi:cation:H+ antiporter